MNSAAKLRKRSVATLAASALIIGGVAPAAFAWTAPGGLTGGDTAGIGSIGLIDADRAEAGTQGAQVVAAGGVNQPIGDVRFVIPSTWAAGDHIDFVLGGAQDAGNDLNTTNLNQLSFVGEPSVNIDAKPYGTSTHIHPTSGATTPDAGSVEDGRDVAYTLATGATAPVAPQVTTTVETIGAGTSYRNVLRLTFTNSSNATADAKFIGSINGAKINVGAGLTGDIALTADAYTGSGTGAQVANFFQDDGTVNGSTQNTDAVEANVTYPATIGQVSLEVSNGNVTADGTSQYVGPITLTSPTDVGAGGTATVSLNGAQFDTTAPVTAVAYNAAGTATNLTVQVNSGSLVASRVPTDARRIVFTNPAVIAPRGTQTYSFEAGTVGAIAPAAGVLGAGDAARNQTDIERPDNLTVARTTATQVPKRLGGQDRYQTAVKIAENDLADGRDVVAGESDNVVIASGEGFADALSAGYLAATKDAQLILTRQGSLPQTDIEFLKTYGAKNIFIVGGTGSVSKAVEDQLRSMQSFDVQVAPEAAGVTTYDVEVVNPQGLTVSAPASGAKLAGLSTNPGTGSHTVAVTRDAAGLVTGVAYDGKTVTPATDNTDAVSYTAATNGNAQVVNINVGGQTVTVSVPQGAPLTAETVTGSFTLRSTAVQSVGTSTVTDQTATGSARRVVPLDTKLTVTRLAGNDRFETNKKVNMYAAETAVNPIGTTVPEYGKAGRKTAILANGMAPWDALAAGPLVGNAAGQNPIPVVLTRGNDTMTQFAADQIGQMDIKHLLFIGGKGVLPEALANETSSRGVSYTRLGGDTRWATAKALSEFALKTAGVSPTNTAPGFGFASATNTKNPYLTNGGSLDGNMSSKVAKGAWADALAAGPSAARQRTIIALTDSEALPTETKDLLTANKAALEPVIALGLGGVVSTKVVNDANAAVAN